MSELFRILFLSGGIKGVFVLKTLGLTRLAHLFVKTYVLRSMYAVYISRKASVFPRPALKRVSPEHNNLSLFCIKILTIH